MADIELVIKISEKVKQAFDNAESNELKGGYYDCGGVIGNAIKNGTPLPKGHGRLIDADTLDECKEMMNTIMGECKYAVRMDDIRNSPTIIEADKGEQ